MKESKVRSHIRDSYGKIASEGTGCGCGCGSSSDIAQAAGYSAEELASAPAGSNLGLGCGNPTAIASLRAGETVLDLGSGAGFDCFLAARRVGTGGKVIGIDMTPAMVEKARENAAREDVANVEFRLGEIEHLPVADNLVDVIISNCVINLSVDKTAVFREMTRVLKNGGRVSVSDIILLKQLPGELAESLQVHTHCVAGAVLESEYLRMATEAGLKEALVEKHPAAIDAVVEADPLGRELSAFLPSGESLSDYIASANFTAVKA